MPFPRPEAFGLSPPTLEKAASPQTRQRCELNTCLSDHQPQPFSPARLRLCDCWEEASAFRPLLCGCTEVLRLGGGGGGEQLLPTQKPVSQPDRQREAVSAGAFFPGALGLVHQSPQLRLGGRFLWRRRNTKWTRTSRILSFTRPGTRVQREYSAVFLFFAKVAWTKRIVQSSMFFLCCFVWLLSASLNRQELSFL